MDSAQEELVSLLPCPKPTPRLLKGIDKWRAVDSIAHEGHSDESTALCSTGDHAFSISDSSARQWFTCLGFACGFVCI